MKILLTGAGGMVGQNIVEDDRFKKFEIFAPSRTTLNLFSYQDTLSYLQKVKPDFVIHCAGRVGGIQANMANPVAFLLENLDINRNLIAAAREAEVKKLINMGSSCMYPRDATVALDEELVLKGELEPTNEGYAIAKIAAQRLCVYINRENPEYKYKTLIPCNLYGRHDKFSPQHSHMVPAVIRKLHEAKVNNASEVDIWGDGTARREFMYCGDLVDCICQGINDFEAMPDLMNVGLGIDYTVNEYYQAAADVVGYKGTFKHDLSKPVGMKQKLTSIKLSLIH
ncbi:MAG: NAD-dependent epimerase/dehydratase family protein, partial [Pseudobdellovibrio sp.]